MTDEQLLLIQQARAELGFSTQLRDNRPAVAAVIEMLGAVLTVEHDLRAAESVPVDLSRVQLRLIGRC